MGTFTSLKSLNSFVFYRYFYSAFAIVNFKGIGSYCKGFGVCAPAKTLYFDVVILYIIIRIEGSVRDSVTFVKEFFGYYYFSTKEMIVVEFKFRALKDNVIRCTLVFFVNSILQKISYFTFGVNAYTYGITYAYFFDFIAFFCKRKKRMFKPSILFF